ncbi:MAG: glycosyltransferase family 2 protein [Bacteriovoracaceae bacterium]
MKTVSVLIPLYNEEKTIIEIIDKVLKLDVVKEVIVVDDCSKDKSFEVVSNIKNERLKVFKNPVNLGKTGAINNALKHVTGDIVIIQDADLEYDPNEIPDVVKPIMDGKADVVFGSRFLVKKTARVLYYYHYLANKFLTFLSNVLTNHNMTDIETCYKAFRAPLVTNLELTSKGFGMEVELTAIMARLGLRIYEVPISYYGRTYEEGKKIGWIDGVHAIFYILYYNLIFPHTAAAQDYFKRFDKN